MQDTTEFVDGQETRVRDESHIVDRPRHDIATIDSGRPKSRLVLSDSRVEAFAVQHVFPRAIFAANLNFKPSSQY